MSYPGMAHALTDHETIRRWAEARGMEPCQLDPETPGSAVSLRLQPSEALRPPALAVSWHEWFRVFDRDDLVLLIEAASRQPSAIHRIVPRVAVVSTSISAIELVG